MVLENYAKGIRIRVQQQGGRDVGWIDLAQAASQLFANGPTEIALTKLDVLSGFESIEHAQATATGETKIRNSASLTDFRKAKPIYSEMAGWKVFPIIFGIRVTIFPETLKQYIRFIEEEVNCPIKIILLAPAA